MGRACWLAQGSNTTTYPSYTAMMLTHKGKLTVNRAHKFTMLHVLCLTTRRYPYHGRLCHPCLLFCTCLCHHGPNPCTFYPCRIDASPPIFPCTSPHCLLLGFWFSALCPFQPRTYYPFVRTSKASPLFVGGPMPCQVRAEGDLNLQGVP